MTDKPTAIIFDMDGTLCDVRSIRHLVIRNHPDNPGHRNFDRFHELSVDCPPNLNVLAAANEARAQGHKVIIVTARQEKYRQLTKWWMLLNGVPFDQQLHRKTGDGRPDRVVKQEILAGLRQHYNIIHAWDDNPNVLALWAEEGIETTVVEGWFEDEPKAVQEAVAV
ncbi:phosphatase domain-containing protein [Arthrobacter sp. 31Y]|uniref:phosphatase domain-containing protein n=1 Tax=Arthrobacter sp. 31Y TaxID=1115632 RepID=UPI0004649673|nr:HAD family acid phosphatase [Arthrobacter sp. 31Y]